MGRSGSFGGGGFGGGFSGGFGGGGGHFSGGFGGGSHSSGGRSGGGSFGGGSSFGGGGSYHGGGSGDFLGGLLVGSLLNNSRGSGYSGSGSGNGGYDGGSGGSGGSNRPSSYQPAPYKPDPYKHTKIVAVIVSFLFMFSLLTSCMASMGDQLSSMSTSSNSIYQTTHAREALPVPQKSKTYFDDQDGDWIYSPVTVDNAMRYFEEKTGVTPYLVILPNASSSINKLSEMADEMYYELFDDENHMLLIFCDDGNGSYKCGYSVGSAAATVTDEEAMQILARYLDRYYNDYSIDESEIFANTFMKTADSIMSYQPPEENAGDAADGESDGGGLGDYAASIVILVVGGIVTGIVYIFDRRREAQRIKDEKTKEILSTPLEKFGDTEIEDLADKYKDD